MLVDGSFQYAAHARDGRFLWAAETVDRGAGQCAWARSTMDRYREITRRPDILLNVSGPQEGDRARESHRAMSDVEIEKELAESKDSFLGIINYPLPSRDRA